MTSCEILRKELFMNYVQKINYEIIKENFSFFPNIEALFGYKWLKKKWQEGYPYHWIIRWLSEVESKESNKIVSNDKTETDSIQKEIKLHEVNLCNDALAWLIHVDSCLEYLNQHVKRGRKDILNNMRDDGNFLQFLNQLDLAKKLSENGYEIELESPSINNRHIDIVAKKKGVVMILELATLDMYSELKYSTVSADIPDRPKALMLSKLKNQIVDYAKDRPGHPILLIFNMSQALDADLHGILYSLQGAEVDNIFVKPDSKHRRFTTFERDPEFLRLNEGRKLTGLIHYTDEFDGLKKYLKGDVIINANAEIELNESSLSELKKALFEIHTQ